MAALTYLPAIEHNPPSPQFPYSWYLLRHRQRILFSTTSSVWSVGFFNIYKYICVSHSYNYPLDYHDDLFGHTWVSLALYRSYKDTAHNFLIWTQQTSVSIFILVMSVIQFMFSHTHTVTLSTCSTCCPKLLFSGSSL